MDWKHLLWIIPCVLFIGMVIGNEITVCHRTIKQDLPGCACCGEFCQGRDCDWNKRYIIDKPICNNESIRK